MVTVASLLAGSIKMSASPLVIPVRVTTTVSSSSSSKSSSTITGMVADGLSAGIVTLPERAV